MAQLGTYKNPGKFKDEDKWLKFFTKYQLVTIGGAVIIAIQVVFLMDKIGLLLIGMIMGVLLITVTAILAIAKLPDSWYLHGGGIPAWKIVFRLLNKQIRKNRKIYIKNLKGGN